MLHLITSLKDKRQDFTFKEILEHRLIYAREESGDPTISESSDGFDTDKTVYLVFSNKDSEIVGSARILPQESIESSMLDLFPANLEIPYILVDTVFHIPSSSSLYDHSDDVAQSQYSQLMAEFHESVTMYLENKAIQENISSVAFYLDEEEIDILQQNTDRSYDVINTLQTPGDEYDRYVGVLDLSDLVRSGETLEKQFG